MFELKNAKPVPDWTEKAMLRVIRLVYVPDGYSLDRKRHAEIETIIDAMPPKFGEVMARFHKYGQRMSVVASEMCLGENEVLKLIHHGSLCIRNQLMDSVTADPRKKLPLIARQRPLTDDLFEIPLSMSHIIQFADLGYSSVHELETASDEDLMKAHGIGRIKINNLRRAIAEYRAGARQNRTVRLIPKARQITREIKTLQELIRNELKDTTDNVSMHAALSSLDVMLSHANDVTANIQKAAGFRKEGYGQ